MFKMLTDITTISFDLDDTLWSNKDVIFNARKKLYEKIIELYPDFENTFSAEYFNQFAMKIYKQKDWKCDLTALRIAHIEQALLRANCSIEKVKELSDYYFYWRNQVKLFPDVEKTLAILASQYSLIAVTNGNANVNEIGIGQYFQFTVCAADVGVKKPSKILYEYAITQADQNPQKIVHVGDKYDEDVQGATAAGMKAIWVNAENKPCVQRPEALVGIIKSIDELIR